jgi:hypothetical protein
MNLKSRKLIIFLVTLIIFVGNAALGSPIPEESLEQVLALVISWLVAQGIADHGSQGAANAALRAAKAGEDIVNEAKVLTEDDTAAKSDS